MNANELRIGNLVLLTKDNFKTTKEYQLSGFDIYKLEESDCEDVKPIPLTEEYFLKLISKYTKGSNKLNHTWVAFHNMHLDLYFDPEKKEYYYHTNQLQGIRIYFVHEFQNLIFALSREELTLK